ncbi:Peptidoglycan O-acetyltransferase [Paraliobacillus sp. PM-2]|uniref:MBOAT family O-acyltransferase n=1 Tax=Paraliobacillus sp. PM-2 TaxID=1462524 RepID=UPI00061BD98A|nr:MBOAT family O-acyltransferase [Paraliobacillus sp. PM-2]CQR47314.1 Peptidoglycan O-acetyltransferase [Paraliobacillus sp. PM-2]
MVFSSLAFLFFFLPIALLIYYSSPSKLRNVVLLLVSLFFYAWGEPVYIILLLFSALSDYWHGQKIATYRNFNQRRAKSFLISSIIINVTLLSFFKYVDFLIENINALFGSSFSLLELPLPIGISFYTFQTMSYCISIYQGKTTAKNNPIDVATYVSLFPQLIAGPIVRYTHIEKQLSQRPFTRSQFVSGIKFFIIGLAKKVLLANNISLLWENVNQQPIEQLSVAMAWLGMVAFAFHIYFDFSGYSDMAIGLGKMFGFDFPENFHYPFISKSMSEFWRRWHMTLGSWFRDYVYIPLGGNRNGHVRWIRNLLIVWGITGLWHGASWNFVIWGLYFALLIYLEKGAWFQRIPSIFKHVYFIVFILIGWVFFAIVDVHEIMAYLQIMAGIKVDQWIDTMFMYQVSNYGVVLFLCLIASLPVRITWFQRWPLYLRSSVSFLYYSLLMLLSTAYLVNDAFNPFIYFRF